jgi:hypothetical protein
MVEKVANRCAIDLRPYAFLHQLIEDLFWDIGDVDVGAEDEEVENPGTYVVARQFDRMPFLQGELFNGHRDHTFLENLDL